MTAQQGTSISGASSKYVGDNFFIQVIEESVRKGAMLDLVLTNRKNLVENVMFQGSCGCSDHEMVEFEILSAVRKAFSKLTALAFRMMPYRGLT